MDIFVVSDTHFNHENIKKYENRPDNFNELIIQNWNKLVKPDDLVIHLGDVIFGENKPENLPKIMAQLNGKKILCRGNHDPKDGLWYMDKGFDFVCDYFVYDYYAFSHCPLTPLPKQANLNWNKEVVLNIHGHFHRNIPNGEDFVLPTGEARTFNNDYYDYKYYKEHQNQYKLVQIEDELRPFTLEEILTK